MLINKLTICSLDRREKRVERIAAELERLEMELLPVFVLSLSISALPHQNDVFKQWFGRRGVKESETPGAVMARHSKWLLRKGRDNPRHSLPKARDGVVA